MITFQTGLLLLGLHAVGGFFAYRIFRSYGGVDAIFESDAAKVAVILFFGVFWEAGFALAFVVLLASAIVLFVIGTIFSPLIADAFREMTGNGVPG
jgi:polyferredoxin